MKNIFDSHAHYDDAAFDEDRETILNGLQDKGVCNVINVGANIESSKKSVSFSLKYPFIFAAVGVHPTEIKDLPKDYPDIILDLLKNEKTVAIGEVGLDYHYDFSPRDVQKKIFEEQLKLAVEHNVPVIIHDREAHMDTMDLLKKYKPRGVVHCFSGSLEMALEVIKLGMYIGLGGAVTFKNAKNPVLVAEKVPIDRILLETDAPYMTPVPYRGKRCDSSLIKYTAQKIAEVRNIGVDVLLEKTKQNAIDLFLPGSESPQTIRVCSLDGI
ncbi:MAG: D-aminoacyl-tRNA deacylase [Eubacteriales bacterium SKADARSKE-1]|nr:D-aminoacyl-tRNA deacylase [Eubacteriales bacterium SKADARSKE-1]